MQYHETERLEVRAILRADEFFAEVRGRGCGCRQDRQRRVGRLGHDSVCRIPDVKRTDQKLVARARRGPRARGADDKHLSPHVIQRHLAFAG